METQIKKSLKLKKSFKRFIKKDLGAWIIIIPSLILFVCFIWYPLLRNVSFSFFTTQRYNKVDFVWFEQYKNIINDDLFQSALINTLKYTMWSLIIGFLIPIILAIILNEIIHCKGAIRSAIYLPNIIPGIAVMYMWAFLFNANDYGVLNTICTKLGFETSLWLDDPRLTIPLIVITMTWKSAGATMLIYLATLQTIDNTFYEAARIEGANSWQRFRLVTLPHLLSQIKILFILQIVSVFQIFYEPMVMTKGFNKNSISLVQLIYKYAFDEYDTGKAAALSVVVSIILLTLTFIYFMVSSDAFRNVFKKKGKKNVKNK